MFRASERIVVSSADTVATPVGVVRDEEGGRLTFVVKATFRFDALAVGDGGVMVATIADEQVPLEGARPSELPGASRDDVGYLGDLWVGEQAEIRVVGHAYASVGAKRHEAEVAVGARRVGCTLVTAREQMRWPLVAAHFEQEPRALVMAVEDVPPSEVVELVGLSPRGERVRFRLPGVMPQLYVDAPVPCDLVSRFHRMWIDTDFARIVTIWHADYVFRHHANEIKRVLVRLAAVGAPVEWSGLPRGEQALAIEVDELGVAAAPDEIEAARLQVAALEAIAEKAQPTLSLAEYAGLSAELAEQPKERATVLERHGWSDAHWMVEEKAWVEKMGDALMAGDGRLAAEFGELFVAAQDGLAQEGEPRTIDDYVRLRVGFERSQNPPEYLEEQEMSLAMYMRMERYFVRRANEDVDVKRTVERELVRARGEAESKPS